MICFGVVCLEFVLCAAGLSLLVRLGIRVFVAGVFVLATWLRLVVMGVLVVFCSYSGMALSLWLCVFVACVVVVGPWYLLVVFPDCVFS